VNHQDHVSLIREGVVGGGKAWAELGSGTGAFTLALADLLPVGGSIISVDRDEGALREQSRALDGRFPGIEVQQLTADFSRPIQLPALDGVLMANSLHFIGDKLPALAWIRDALRADGRLVLVEYDTDHGNRWVPYPISASSWAKVARDAGFRETRRIASHPSRFLGSIYSAVSRR